MKFIEARNSSKSVDTLLNGESFVKTFDYMVANNHIHRKNKEDRVRFNPKFKEHVGDRGIAFTVGEEEFEGKLLLVVGDYAWRVNEIKTANQKAGTLTNLMDLTFHNEETEDSIPKTNRYSLEYLVTNEYGDLFEIVPAEEVPENTRKATEEQRQRLLEQLERGRATRDANREATESPAEELIGSVEELTEEVSEEINFQEPNVESTSVQIG